MEKKREKGRSGATLTEAVIVIAIIAVLAAVLTPSLIAYARVAEINELDANARSVFLAAQGYLTEAYNSGELSAINEYAQTQGRGLSGLVEAENSEALYYLTISRDGTGDEYLTRILDQYLGDERLLSCTVTIEYNSKTGNCYSALISKTADAFTYGAGGGTRYGTVGIADRSAETRRRLMFGYYGADSNAVPPELLEPVPFSAMLVNGEQLYLRWTDAYPDAPAGTDVTYTIEFFRAEDDTLLMSVDIPSAGIKTMDGANGGRTADFALGYNAGGLQLTATATYGGGVYSAPEKFWVYRHTEEGVPGYELVLDSCDATGSDGYSVTARYMSVLAGREIYARVSAVSEGYEPADPVTSNAEHSMFTTLPTGEYTQADVSAGIMGVANARHLHNLRYQGSEGKYEQAADIDWAGFASGGYVIVKNSSGGATIAPEGDKNLFTGFAFYKDGGEIGYIGEYDGGGYAIENIAISPSGRYAGLFSQTVRKNNNLRGYIHDLSLLNVTVTGENDNGTGALVGYNGGNLENITVSGNITGGDNTGGVAGVSVGGCENVKVVHRAIEGVSHISTVTGGENVGGIVGQFTDFTGWGSHQIAGYESAAHVTGDANVGGIVGQTGNKKQITGCTVTGLVHGRDRESNRIGGIAGYCGAGISECTVEYDGSAALPEGYALDTPGYNVGGIVGYGENKTTVSNCTVASRISGSYNVGGIVGNNAATVTGCGTAGSVVVGIDDPTVTDKYKNGAFIGGIIGFQRSGNTVSDLENGADVIGNRFVGGITGTSGYIYAPLTDPDIAQTFTGSARISISYCKNTGEVVARIAYGGGIVGYNYDRTINGCTSDNDGDLTALGLSPEECTGSYIGGIAGYNSGTISANGATQINPVVYGKSYVGGVVGCNAINYGAGTAKSGNVSAYYGIGPAARITGAADGCFVGGVIGLNNVMNPANISGANSASASLTCYSSEAAVTGGSCTGGVIGANIVRYGALTVTGGAGAGSVTGTRYVGGILGYNAFTPYFNNNNANNRQRTADAFRTAIAAAQGELTPQSPEEEPGYTLTLSNVKNSMRVTGGRFAGGLLGYNDTESCRLILSGCENAGSITVTGTQSAYGSTLTGYIGEFDRAEDCFNTGLLTSSSDRIGGLTERNDGLITGCYNAGGIICIPAAGAVAAGCGGIAGENNGRMEFCETRAGVFDPDGATSYVYDRNMRGGIAGVNAGVIEGCVNRAAISGESSVGGIAGRVTGGSMARCRNFGAIAGVSAVGGIAGSSGAGQNSLELCVNFGELSSNAAVSGCGGVIGDIGETQDGTHILACANFGSIDLTGAPGGECVGGIAGKVSEQGALENCTQSAAIAAPLCDGVGGIAGDNAGTVTDCVTAALDPASYPANEPDFPVFVIEADAFQITGARFVGGLAGRNSGTLTCARELGFALTNAYNVSGVFAVGGIAGELSGDLVGAYNAGRVAGGEAVGGIAGVLTENGYMALCVYNGGYLGTATDAGGLIGRREEGQNELSYCYATDTNLRRAGNIAENTPGGATDKPRAGDSVDITAPAEFAATWEEYDIIAWIKGFGALPARGGTP